MSEYVDQQKLLIEFRSSTFGKKFQQRKESGSQDPFYAMTLEGIIDLAHKACTEKFPVFYQHTLRELVTRCLQKESLNVEKHLDGMLNEQRYRKLYLSVQETQTCDLSLQKS